MTWQSSLLVLAFASVRVPTEPNPSTELPCAAELRALQTQLIKVEDEVQEEWLANKDKAQAEQEAVRKRLFQRRNDVGNSLAERIMDTVRPFAADPAAIDALTAVLRGYAHCHRSDKAAAEAVALLCKYHARDPKTFEVADQFVYDPKSWTVPLLSAVAAADLPTESKCQALYSLAECLKEEAWLATHYAELQQLDPYWAIVQERRYGKEFLARLKNEQAKNEADAIRFFNEVADKYGDVSYPRGKNRTYREYAKGGAFAAQSLSIGKEAPDFTCTNVSGSTVRLCDLKGRVVVLDFWYVACNPCREQFPHLRQMQTQYAGKPLTIVGVTADEDREKWEQFLKKVDLPWKQWYSGRGGVVARWNVTTFPTRYLIDHKGIIRDSNGLRDEAFDRYLEKLVAEAEAVADEKNAP
jgi:peroxiredoxin